MDRSYRRLLGVLIICFGATAVCAEEITIYSGRSKSLVKALVKQMEKETGLTVKVRYGKSAAMAMTLREEGDRSPADVFWSQDAGALSALSNAGLLTKLPDDIVDSTPATLHPEKRDWVATSGRARVLAYSTKRVQEKDLPKSVFDLTDPKWKGRVGWAPANASFQAFVTGMRALHGDAKTRQWLVAMKANGAKTYPKNTPIIRALANGEIDLGLPNHYYLLRFKKSDSKFPVAQTSFAKGDPGNMLNVAGAAVLASSKKKAAAQKVIRFLLSAKAQQYFTSDTFEYPVSGDVIANPALVDVEVLLEKAAPVPFRKLGDLIGTLKMLRDVGLL